MRVYVQQGHRYSAMVRVTGWKSGFATADKVRDFFEDEGFAVERCDRAPDDGQGGRLFAGTAVRRDASDWVDDDRIVSFQDLGPA